jgi:hypothetical protein
MAVAVATGSLVAPTPNNSGSCLCYWDAIETVTVGPAPGAGQSRLDWIVAQLRGNDLDGGANNDFIFVDVQGVVAATGSQVAPAVPAGALAIAQLLVPGNTVTIAGGNLTDTRPGNLSVPAPVPAPPPQASGQVTTVLTSATASPLVTATFPVGRFSTTPNVLATPVTNISAWARSQGTTATSTQIASMVPSAVTVNVIVAWFATLA